MKTKVPEFNIYPDLDADVVAAQNSDLLSKIDLAKTIGADVKTHIDLSPEEVRRRNEWAEREIDGALEKWRIFENFDLVMPATAYELLQAQDLEKLSRLFVAKTALNQSGEKTPGGRPVGETMHLVIVPWGAFKKHGADFSNWHRDLQNPRNSTNASGQKRWMFSIPQFIEGVVGEKNYEWMGGSRPRELAWYRDPDDSVRLLTTEEYLNKKIDTDGPIGLMLMQTSNEAGTETTANKSPDELTDGGSKHLEVAGLPVDAMGFFEWLALNLQEDPHNISNHNKSLLLANRFNSKSSGNRDFTLEATYWAKQHPSDLDHLQIGTERTDGSEMGIPYNDPQVVAPRLAIS